jgi:DNA-binding CsgD family transcriptional regulator
LSVFSFFDFLGAGMIEPLIDRIYEAAAVPALWAEVLTDLNVLAKGFFSSLVATTPTNWHTVTSTGGESLVSEYLAEGWAQRTDRLQRLVAARHAGFIRHLDMYGEEDALRQPFYIEFSRPRGIGWGGGASLIAIPTGEMLFLSVEYRDGAERMDAETIRKLDVLRPHVARAALFSARLAFEKAQATTAALDIVGLPAGVLSRSMKLIAANRRLDAMVPSVIRDSKQRITLASPNADALLAAALAQHSASMPSTVGSVPIPATHEHPPYIIHIVPTRGAANDVFSNAAAILVVTPVVPSEVPTAEVLQGLFDLTPAEARVARGVGELQTLEAIAADAGVSRETIRSQMRAVLIKTGMTRQGDLAALLAGTRLPRE